MLLHKVHEFLARPWSPEVYTFGELEGLLGVSAGVARSILLSIHPENCGDVPWVTHHELAYYLKDILAVSAVPAGEADLSPHERWLVSRGWRLDGMRELYRWVDPLVEDSQTCPVRLSLRGALFVECSRARVTREADARRVANEDSELAAILGGFEVS